MDTDIESIVQRTLKGDIDAFGEIVTQYQRTVWTIAACMLRDRDSTEDLVQRIFLKVYENMHQYTAGRDFEKWMKGVARNEVRMAMRQRMREQDRLRRYEEHILALMADSERADRYQSTLKEALRACREALSESAAKALFLRYDRGQAFKEIALTLGRSVVATRQMLNRIRENLRDCIHRTAAQT